MGIANGREHNCCSTDGGFFFFFGGGGVGPRRSRDGWVRTPRCERVERVDSQSSIASLNGEFSGSGGWEKEKSPIL